MQPLSSKHCEGQQGLCQESVDYFKATNGSVLQLLSAAELFITAVMTTDDCFDGISDLIHDLLITLIPDTKGYSFKTEDGNLLSLLSCFYTCFTVTSKLFQLNKTDTDISDGRYM